MEKPFAITLDVGSSLANKTGSWRTERAVHVDRLPPCNHACPAGENIQQWLYNAEEGGARYERGWRQIMEDNPFPAIMGRVCYHPCETSCNRGQLDEAVGINSVERFLGDQAIEQGWKVDPPASDLRQARAGGGGRAVRAVRRLPPHPAGARGVDPRGGAHERGHDALRHSEVPLPRDVLDAEVQRILEMGVTLELNRKVTNVEESMKDGGFDAAFLAVGAHISKRTYIPAGESAHILDALSVLRSMEGEEQPMLGRRVVVYGGGNTAMDVARTAKRLGAAEAVVVYRRTRERMPAHDFEVEEAEEEGVLMRWLSTIKHADEGKLLIEKMELDETGFPQPTGEIEELEADSVVLALGQDTDLSLLEGVAGIEVRGRRGQGGAEHDDRTPGDLRRRRHGARRAHRHGGHRARQEGRRNIDGWLRGQAYEPPPKHELVTFDMLNTWYYADAPRTAQPQLDPIRRQGTFDEVVQGLDESNALFEARRCLSCGNCFSCDNCYGVCPDNAVLKLGGRSRVSGYAIDLDFCKGCGICVAECPSRGDQDGAGGDLMRAPAATKWVYDFAEGSRELRELLGGKGANLAEMTRVLGPELVPAGFTITTEACVAYMEAGGTPPAGLVRRSRRGARSGWRSRAGRRLGDPDDPLLLSVRSGARSSMPGMMDTVLNLGLNDATVEGLATHTGNPRFAWDCYRRLVQMFGDVVHGVAGGALRGRDRRASRPNAGSRWTPSSTPMRCAS